MAHVVGCPPFHSEYTGIWMSVTSSTVGENNHVDSAVMERADNRGESMEPEECSPFFYRCRLKPSRRSDGGKESSPETPAARRCSEERGRECAVRSSDTSGEDRETRNAVEV